MSFRPNLQKILDEELSAGNRIVGEHKNEYLICKYFVVLEKPFQIKRDSLPLGIVRSENHDFHYEVGVLYQDMESKDILIAPFSL